MKIRQLFEKRKNPHLNPKVGFTATMDKRLSNAYNLPNSQIPNEFVSFTAINKLGINPKSKYNTPIGIYAYPLSYVKDEVGEGSTSKLPFAGSQPYANFFSIKDNATVILSSTFYTSDLMSYLTKLRSMFGDDAVVGANNEYEETATYEDSPFGTLWGITYWLTVKEPNSAVAWNKLLRELGIDAFVDMGYGTIHNAEPTQMVVLNPTVITNVERIENKGHSEIMALKQELDRAFRSRDKKDIAHWLLKVGMKKLPNFNPSPKIIMQFLGEEPKLLQYFTLPAEYEIEVIRNYPEAMGYIQNFNKLLVDNAIKEGLFKNLLKNKITTDFVSGLYAMGRLNLKEGDLVALINAVIQKYATTNSKNDLKRLESIIDKIVSRSDSQKALMVALSELTRLVSLDEVYDMALSINATSTEYADALAYALLKEYNIDYNAKDLRLLHQIILSLAQKSEHTGGYVGEALKQVANTISPYDDLNLPRSVSKALIDNVDPKNLANLVSALTYRKVIPSTDIAKVLQDKSVPLDIFKKQIENINGKDSPMYMELDKLG